MQTLQLAMFDKHAAERAKQHGMTEAATGSREFLVYARAVARELAAQRPQGITADDVQLALVERGHDIHQLGNAAGSLFRGPEWIFTGERRRSVRIHAHANELKVWRLK
jgi:glucose-6-phosphate-specific signal transduction histidine kinase